MEHRLENDKIPARVKKLMREEEARGFENAETTLYTDRWTQLRTSYCKMLEDYLDDLGLRTHWGKTLKQKMRKFSSEAITVLEEWADFHGIELAVRTDNEDDEDELTIKLKEYPNDEERILAGERLYDDSPYGILLRTLDKV